MKRTRWLGLALIALALAGIAGLVAASEMGHRKAPTLTTAVVVAARRLRPGVPLQPGDLTTVALPPNSLPAHVFQRPQQLDGRVLTTAAVPHQVVLAEMLAPPGSGAGLPPLIPAGMRAVSVKVNDVVAVAGYVLPGTHVDVLLTGNPNGAGSPRGVATITLLTNVRVLTAGEQLEKTGNGRPQKVTVITLLVSPEGAEKLALGERYGYIQLALRNPLDQQRPTVAPVLNAALFRGIAPRPARVRLDRPRRPAPPPPAPPAPQPAVEMLLGSKRHTFTFPAPGAVSTASGARHHR